MTPSHSVMTLVSGTPLHCYGVCSVLHVCILYAYPLCGGVCSCECVLVCRVFARVPVYLCQCESELCVPASVCLYASVCVCLWMCVSAFQCVCVPVSVWVCRPVCVCACVLAIIVFIAWLCTEALSRLVIHDPCPLVLSNPILPHHDSPCPIDTSSVQHMLGTQSLGS